MDRLRVAASLFALLCLSIGCGGGDGGGVPRPTATPPASATASPPQTATPSIAAPATATAQATSTGLRDTSTATPSRTACSCDATPTATSMASPSPASGVPEITYFGVVRADDLPQQPAGVDTAGRPIFMRVQGQGMTLVLEAQRGNRALEFNAYDPEGGPRGVEFLVSRPLGDGSAVVCDTQPPLIGGVPGFDPPVFSDAPAVEAAIDDLGCRVSDGAGAPRGRIAHTACTLDATSEYGFVEPSSEIQYCLPIAKAWGFPLGDTIVAARVRDVAGQTSAPRELVVRVLSSEPFGCDDPQSLGERAFAVARPASKLLTSLTGSDDVSRDPWLPGPLRICAGPDQSGGVRALALREDAVLGLGAADGSTLCVKLAAAGSGGILDCDGGTAADILAAQTVGSATTVDSGLGLDAGTGAAVLRAPVAFVQLPAGTPPSACTAAAYPDAAFTAALTTATGAAQVLDARGTVLAEVQASGVNFDCATWRQGGGASFVLPFPAIGTSSGDVAAALVLTE